MRKLLLRVFGIVGLLLILLMIVPFLIPISEAGVDPATLADPDGHFITVNGIDLYYREAGTPGNPTVILLHGFGGGTWNWRYQLPALAEAGYYVIAFDRPPYGLSEKVTDFTYSAASYAELTFGLMDALSIETAVVAGHSAGGTVIANMVLQQPERIEGLVFVAGAVGIQSGSPSLVSGLISFPPINRWARIIARSVVTPEYFAGIISNPEGSPYAHPEQIPDDVIQLYTVPLQLANWDAAFLNVVRDSGQNSVTAAALSEIDIPTLIQWGELDTWVELPVGERLAQAIPGAELIVYPDAGHMVMEEAPEAFNRDLIGFLDQLNP
jgi:pimeloyl-ACP methyl ester carboxylesterase